MTSSSGVAVVAFGRKGDVAVDAGVLLELVEIADDLFRRWPTFFIASAIKCGES